MKFLSRFFFATSIVLLGACATPQAPQLTPAEIQSLQTREFDTTKEIAFPSAVSVFQDIGYNITQADLATGFISAESAANSDAASKFWLGVSAVSQTKATAYIEQIGKISRVRINFVTSTNKSYGYGQSDREDTPILSAEAYQNAFEKIENAIFVRTP